MMGFTNTLRTTNDKVSKIVFHHVPLTGIEYHC